MATEIKNCVKNSTPYVKNSTVVLIHCPFNCILYLLMYPTGGEYHELYTILYISCNPK